MSDAKEMDAAREWIVQTARDNRYTLKDLSRHLGHSDAYIQQFVKRGTPKFLDFADARKLGLLFNIKDSSWQVLLEPRFRQFLSDPSWQNVIVSVGENNQTRVVRVADKPATPSRTIQHTAHVAAAGHPATDDGVEVGEWRIPRDMLPPGDYKAVTVRGDSMEPTLRSGDVVIVDRGQRDPVGLCLISNDGLMVKRLHAGKVISDNPIYEPHPIGSAYVEGRVVLVIKRV